jgi:excisionase family DNA binding protein
MEEFFTVYEAAAILKVHPITIRRYIREGKLKAVKAAGNIRIAKSGFTAFTESFVPNQKPNKGLFATNKEANFSFEDPIFRLKARGLGIKNNQP